VHPDLRRELLELLRKPALARVLSEARSKLGQNREIKGRIKIESRDEADALEDLIGRGAKPGGTIAVAEIDRRLREETIFHCSLEEAVVLHAGEPIVRPKEEKARAAAARGRAVRRCFEALPELGLSPEAYARVIGWMHAEETSLHTGLRLWGEAELLKAVAAVALAFDRMPRTGQPAIFLADLSNEVTRGDSHGLDAGRPASTLLLRALEHHHPETARRERRGSGAWRSALLEAAGIARDPISVRVDTFGLSGDTRYLRELRAAGVDRPFTLNTLAGIGDDVRAWRDVAFVVENPTVFAKLITEICGLYVPERHPTLVCTNGNLNQADKALLDRLVARGAHLFYSGDFDAAGLDIAAAVLARYPGAASPWRMTVDDYRAAARGSEKAIDPSSLQRVRRVFPELVGEMTRRRATAYQEALIPALVEDVDQFARTGRTPPKGGSDPDPRKAAHSNT
jgi:uncharacterized protein (TIGR02679 family)